MALTIPNKSEAAVNAIQALAYQTDINAMVHGIGGNGIFSGAAVTAQGSPNNTIAVSAGYGLLQNTLVTIAAGNVTMPTADTTNPMWVLIVVNASGTKSTISGTPATISGSSVPLLPAYDSTLYIPLAAVLWPANATSVTSGHITDKRIILHSRPPMPRPKRSGVTYYDVPGIPLRNWATSTFEGYRIYYFPLFPEKVITISAIRFRITSAAAATNTGRVAIYRANEYWQPNGLINGVTDINITATGATNVSFSATLAPVPYLMAFWATANVTLGCRLASLPHTLRENLEEYDLLRSWKKYYDAAVNTSWDSTGIAWDDGDNTNTGFEMPLFVDVA